MLGENSFYGWPEDFRMFVRNNSEHVTLITKLEEQQKVFASHNMPEVVHAVRKRIKNVEEMRKDSYFGFQRLKPMDAAMIAARMLGIKWHDTHFLTVPFKFFETCYWSEQPQEKPKGDIKQRLLKTAMVENTVFSYQPRLYPLASFPDLPRHVIEVLGIVESLPELNGCPAFDYYWVLMPSININHAYFHHKDKWEVVVRGKDEQRPWNNYETLVPVSFTDEYEAAMALDKTLVADGYFSPVVLGEADGRCYFVTIF